MSFFSPAYITTKKSISCKWGNSFLQALLSCYLQNAPDTVFKPFTVPDFPDFITALLIRKGVFKGSKAV